MNTPSRPRSRRTSKPCPGIPTSDPYTNIHVAHEFGRIAHPPRKVQRVGRRNLRSTPIMGSRKRGREQMEAVEPVPEVAEEPSTLGQIREMWEFASLMQYLFFFGKAVKLEDLDVEVRDDSYAPWHITRTRSIKLMLLDGRTSKTSASSQLHRKD